MKASKLKYSEEQLKELKKKREEQIMMQDENFAQKFAD